MRAILQVLAKATNSPQSWGWASWQLFFKLFIIDSLSKLWVMGSKFTTLSSRSQEIFSSKRAMLFNHSHFFFVNPYLKIFFKKSLKPTPDAVSGPKIFPKSGDFRSSFGGFFAPKNVDFPSKDFFCIN